jgi:hypothetical protein
MFPKIGKVRAAVRPAACSTQHLCSENVVCLLRKAMNSNIIDTKGSYPRKK